MSTIITGDATTVASSLARTITDASNTTPIEITTSVPHFFDTFDRVTISGVLGNTAANGTWRITKTNSTKFQLVGSAGSGAYTSGGTATDLSLTPQFTIPSDGDGPPKASDMAVAFEALADRTQFLVEAIQDPLTPIRTTGLLKAIDTTSLPNDTVRHVRGQGLYTLDTSLSVAEDSPWILAPNTGPGRWVNGVASEATTSRYYAPRDLMRMYIPRRAKTTGPPGYLPASTDVQQFTSGHLVFQTTDAGVTNQDAIVFDVGPCLVHGAYLDSLVLQVVGAGGHAALPAVMPSFGIFRRTATTVEALLSGTWVDDPSASVAAYEALHDVTLSPDPLAGTLVIDRTAYSYELHVWNEGSTNAVLGFELASIVANLINIPHANRP